jgi:predicted dehydrogenase
MLCEKHGSDKGYINFEKNTPYGWKAHTYTNVYYNLFNHCKNEIKLIFECGIGSNNSNYISNMSLGGKPGGSDWIGIERATGRFIALEVKAPGKKPNLLVIDALIKAAVENGRILTCYHPYRFKEDFVTIREVLSSGRLGRLVEIKCNRSSFSRRNDWVMRKAKGGGQNNVWGSHTIDQCLQIAQSPVRDVFSDLQRTVTPGDADDHCKIVLRCESGVLVDAEVSNCMAFSPQPEWMVAGTCGGLVSLLEGVKVKWFDPKEAPPIGMNDGPAADRKYGNDDRLPWREETVPYPKTRGFVEFYDNVAAAIRDGAQLLITPESVRETIAVLEICRIQNPHIWAGVE